MPARLYVPVLPMALARPVSREAFRRAPLLLVLAMVLLSGSFESVPSQNVTYSVSNASQLLAVVAAGLQPGDTVLLEPGVYSLVYLYLNGVSGSSEGWITFRSRTGRAILTSASYQDVIRLVNCNYLRFEDLEITSTNGNAGINGVTFAAGGSNRHITFDGCFIHDVTAHGIYSQATLLENLTVARCEIAHAAVCGIYLGWPDPLQLAANTVIRDCYIHHCSSGSTGYGIQIKGGSYGARIENNVLHDVGAPTRAGIAVYYAALQGNQPPAAWNVIRGNVLWNVPNEAIYASNSALIENNVIVDSGTGIAISSYAGSVIDGLTIRNNTLHRCALRGVYLTGLQSANASVTVVNNAVFATVPASFAYRAPQGVGGATFANNGFFGTNYNVASGLIPLNDPSVELVQSTGPVTSLDLYPLPTSTLIGAASITGAPVDDINGDVRQPGTAVGAYGGGLLGNPGWALAESLPDVVRGLSPAHQEISGVTGGVVTLNLRTGVPAGTPYFVLISARGPATQGSLPLLLDLFSELPFGPVGGPFFSGYYGQTGGASPLTLQLQVPPLPLMTPITVYHAAVFFDPAQNSVTISDPVRVVLGT